jgi:hypothetical protein
MMTRAGAACLLGLVLVCCGPSSAIAKKHKKLSSCQKLGKHHKDLATSRMLLVVVRGNERTGRISGCVLPRGKVRTLAEWDDDAGRQFGGVVDTAGTWVLVYQGGYDQGGGQELTLSRIDVRHDTPLVLSRYSCSTGAVPSPPCPDGTDYGRAQIAPSGAGAFELIDNASKTTTLKAFNPAGAITTLADGAVDSLRVTRTQISWTQLGSAHTVPLPE